ncbi:MAG: ABC transporter permease [Burkholderiales bacterium]
MLDSLRQDLAYAARRLVKSPGFTLVAALTLALGIGATSAIFSVVNAVLLRPLPFPEPERLVEVDQVWKGKPVSYYSPQNFLDVEAQAKSFERLAALDTGGFTLTGKGAAARLEGGTVSVGFFEVLHVRPTLGRVFVAGENEPGRDKVVVLGHKLWQDRFGGDPGVVGQAIEIDRETRTVVGVAPPGFSYPEGTELWVPLQYDEIFRTHSRGAWYLNVVGRLAPGASVEGASREVATIAARLEKAYPDHNEGVGGMVRSLHEALVGDTRPALVVLLGAVGLVLLVACINVANLLLARISGREGELAVRAALGAGRGRIVGQLFTESVLLALVGGVLGVLLAGVAVDALLALSPENVPRLAEVRIDRGILAFAVLLSLVTSVAFGALPALQMSRRATSQSLRQGSRGVLGGARTGLRGGLVIGQIALAMVLLAGSGLLLRSFTLLRQVDPGFDAKSALTFRVSLPESAYPEDAKLIAFHRRLDERLSAIPGVREVGAVSGLPLVGGTFVIAFAVDGRPEVPLGQQPSLQVAVATAGYLKTMGIEVVRGRGFDARDEDKAPQVVLLSEAAVREHFPGEEPIGKRIRLGLGNGRGKKAGGEVVGVVRDTRHYGLAKNAPAQIYVAYAQYPTQSTTVVLRTDVPPRSLATAAEAAVHELDPQLAVARIATLEEVVARSISQPRFYTLLLGSFAASALFLAALGLFGVMSYAVAQRTRELAVRMALGARQQELRRMVLREAAGLGAIGLALGLGGALLLSRALTTLLYSISPHDPLTLAGVGLLLLATTLVAGYLPARRATRIDPVVALRAD